jgi:hypothetical protein
MRTTTAVRVTGTAIFRTGAVAAISVFALAGCGSGAKQGQPGGSKNDPFSWLAPGPAPAGWRTASIPTGATLSYPPGWRHVHGDTGTATVILYGPRRQIAGYLNITPRQGAESLSNWSKFRIAHDADEGDRGLKQLDAGTGLRFRSGHGSCVRDSYTTSSHASYIELACLVAGGRATTVIVGASPPAAWPKMSAVIEKAVSAFEP